MQLPMLVLWLLTILASSAALTHSAQSESQEQTFSQHAHLLATRERFLDWGKTSSNSSSVSPLDVPRSPWANRAVASFVSYGAGQPGELNVWFGILVLPVFYMISASDQASGAVIVTSWMLSSIVMNIVNKEAATAFKATGLLVILQMVAADVVILLSERHKLVCGRWSDLMKWMIIPAFFAGMLSTSLLSLKLINLSTVLVLRNVLPLFAFAVEKLLFDTPSRVTANLVVAMVVTLLGTTLYGRFSIAVTPIGALIVLCNCAITVADRVLQRSFLKNPDFSVSISLCMLLNNTFGILPVLVFAACSGEMLTWRDTIASATSESWFWVVMSGLCGCALGFLGLRCQQVISATTFLMLQNFNKIALIGIGVLFFGDQIGGSLAVMGCYVSLFGSIWYGVLRLPLETAEHEPPHLRGKSPGAGMAPAERALACSGRMAPLKLPQATLPNKV